MARFDSVREEQGTHTFYKVRLALPTGETRVANIAIAPLQTRDFAVVGRIILVDDITERIELETQLTQAEKLSSIGLLAAGVAHEVNTPLAVISSYTQMLAKQMRPMMDRTTHRARAREDYAADLPRVRDCQRPAELLADRRHGVRLCRSEPPAARHADAAGAPVQDDDDSRRYRSRSGPAAHPRQRGQAAAGRAEPSAERARRHARLADARIRIATEQRAGHVWVVVQDSGGGIEPENLHRIFDPFFTTKTKPRNGQHKGTGLGLAVSYGIMQEHAGKMHVQSEVGVGTTFRLEFLRAYRAILVAGGGDDVRRPRRQEHGECLED